MARPKRAAAVKAEASMAEAQAQVKKRAAKKTSGADTSATLTKRRSVSHHPDTKFDAPKLTSALLDSPGFGWSNGDVKASLLYPYSRDGKVKLYGHERR
jgi:hypothetical protein